jgi:hypothetical protein
MSDFVTLSCPNCGGKLEISPETISLSCQYCGVEHLVRNEAGSILLESFARCPICKRNDRVEKVSAVVDNQTSGIAIKLSPPKSPSPLPEPKGGLEFYQWGIIIIVVYCSILVFILSPIKSSSLMDIIVLIVLIALAPIINRKLIANEKKIFFSKLKPEWERAKQDWDEVFQKWKQLYYCSRDGIVYDPDTGESCDPDEIKEFIYKFSTVH